VWSFTPTKQSYYYYIIATIQQEGRTAISEIRPNRGWTPEPPRGGNTIIEADKILLSADKETYEPGEEAKIRVKVRQHFSTC
jgi:hypothetical protein